MAKGFKHGSGGLPLNFQVVGGTTQPTNPKENTIWVNTDTKITGWVFSATQPTEPTEGMVWIYTGTASPAEFNALKKNDLHIYPIKAKQYIGDAWCEKEAKTYRGEAWVDWWNGELYDSGNQYETYTGGWRKLNGNTFNLNEDHMEIKAVTGSEAAATTNNPIDTTGFSKICFEYSSWVPGSEYAKVGLCKTLTTSLMSLSWAAASQHPSPNNNGAKVTVEIPIANVQGEYYPVCMTRDAGRPMLVYKVWMA